MAQYGGIFPINVFPDYIWPDDMFPGWARPAARIIQYELQDQLEIFRKKVETIAAAINSDNALLAKIEVESDVISTFPTGKSEMIITFKEDWVSMSDPLE